MFGNATSSTVQSLSVIDPCNRTGKIEIPIAFVSETKGVSDWLRNAPNPPPDQKDLSLCLLFQRGRCNAGARCNQVHAAVEFVEGLRLRAASVKSCCARHGDVHSVNMDKSLRVVVTSESAPASTYSMADFAMTEALDGAVRRARDNVARVSFSRLCRLHQKGCCKFGKDCKNIHLCPAAVPLSATAELQGAISSYSSSSKRVSVTLAPSCATPCMGLAFRALDISTRGVCDVSTTSVSSQGERSVSKAASDDGLYAPAVNNMTCASMLSGFEEFNSFRKEAFELDPLDILEHDSAFSDVSARDFDAFVDALVECGPESLSSPGWVAAA